MPCLIYSPYRLRIDLTVESHIVVALSTSLVYDSYMKLNFDDNMESWRDDFTTAKPSKPKRFVETGSKFYDSRAWKMLRNRVFRKYGRICMRCDVQGNIPIQVDHIKPKSLYPNLALEFSNMQVLCIDCNRWKGTRTIDFRK